MEEKRKMEREMEEKNKSLDKQNKVLRTSKLRSTRKFKSKTLLS